MPRLATFTFGGGMIAGAATKYLAAAPTIRTAMSAVNAAEGEANIATATAAHWRN